MPSFLALQESLQGDVVKLIKALSVDTQETRETELYIKEYEGERTRRTKSVGLKPNKTVTVYNENEATGEVTKGETKTVITAKLVLPFPKKIVRTRVHFLFGGKMVVSAANAQDAIVDFKKQWSSSLKMQNVLKELARTCMIETKAAVIFYPATVTVNGKAEVKLRAQILNKAKGDFYPHFDDYGDMDAFLYLYKALTAEAKAVEKARIYTADTIFTYIKDGGAWKEDDTDPETPAVNKHTFGKIPVVYVEQKEPEWESITTMMDNFENRISRLADTNDYFSEPLLKIFGKASKLPGKEEVGKVLEFDMNEDADGKQSHGDAEYATWDDSPESIKLDLTTSWDSIFSMTSTPDLSFNNIKGIGNVSGVSLKLMFLDAFIARGEKMEIFDPALRRCISVVISGMENYSNIKMKGDVSIDDIEVSFTDILPSDIKELVETIFAATGGKQFLSQKSAVSISPFTNDSGEEIGLIQSETTEAAPNESFT